MSACRFLGLRDTLVSRLGCQKTGKNKIRKIKNEKRYLRLFFDVNLNVLITNLHFDFFSEKKTKTKLFKVLKNYENI